MPDDRLLFTAHEAPLRTESFLNPDTADFDYEYLWYPQVLDAVTKSTEKMVRDAMGAGDNFWTKVLSDTRVRTELLDAIAIQIKTHANFELVADEREVINRAAMLVGSEGSRAYAVAKAIGACISRRARVGWTTWGHTGVDVNLYSFGPGSAEISGSLENSQVGNRIATLMGIDLLKETDAMAAHFSSINLTATVKGQSKAC